MSLKEGLLARVAAQLGHPSGILGRIVGRALNRGNKTVVSVAVESAGVERGSTVADIGFGGGVGLGLLLDQVGDAGTVHGVEISTTMLGEARHRFRQQIAAGSLRLYEAPMEHLPLQTDSVDAVVSTNTVYFISALSAAFAELARVLRPGGRLILGVGDPKTMARMPFTKHGFTLRPIDEIVEQLRKAGFSTVEDRLVDEKAEFHILVCGLAWSSAAE